MMEAANSSDRAKCLDYPPCEVIQKSGRALGHGRSPEPRLRGFTCTRMAFRTRSCLLCISACIISLLICNIGEQLQQGNGCSFALIRSRANFMTSTTTIKADIHPYNDGHGHNEPAKISNKQFGTLSNAYASSISFMKDETMLSPARLLPIP